MKTRLILPALAALALVAAAPASAQIYARYAPQGGGGAGPYAAGCKRYANFHQKQRCTQLASEHYYWRHHRRHWYR